VSELHVRVTGVVQGVGFRWFVRERARRLGLAGWVRNLTDGTVEVLATGGAEKLELLRCELRRGPAGAAVQDVIAVSQPAAEVPLEPFNILR
jgi:acylphosphatase